LRPVVSICLLSHGVGLYGGIFRRAVLLHTRARIGVRGRAGPRSRRLRGGVPRSSIRSTLQDRPDCASSRISVYSGRSKGPPCLRRRERTQASAAFHVRRRARPPDCPKAPLRWERLALGLTGGQHTRHGRTPFPSSVLGSGIAGYPSHVRANPKLLDRGWWSTSPTLQWPRFAEEHRKNEAIDEVIVLARSAITKNGVSE
jgi:hypothetical protein